MFTLRSAARTVSVSLFALAMIAATVSVTFFNGSALHKGLEVPASVEPLS
ncbi:MAG: hypothetical protein Q8J78_08515 [Moraxellaceae bacterium]|nr:hypothetical protein [Moraxellaceae bacterium]